MYHLRKVRNLAPKEKYDTIENMEKIKLISDEKKELEKRGFFIKNTINIKRFLKDLPMLFLFMIISISF
jgi:hypothetical protein